MNFSELSAKYGWIEWSSIPNAAYLALVIRKLRSEYVVHIYNHDSDGHSGGDYFDSFDEAKKRYVDRLAKYELKI